MEGLDGFTHMSGTLEGTEGGTNLGLLIREPVHVPPRFVGLFFFFWQLSFWREFSESP